MLSNTRKNKALIELLVGRIQEVGKTNIHLRKEITGLHTILSSYTRPSWASGYPLSSPVAAAAAAAPTYCNDKTRAATATIKPEHSEERLSTIVVRTCLEHLDNLVNNHTQLISERDELQDRVARYRRPARSIAIGDNATATAVHSIAIGNNATAMAIDAIAVGAYNDALIDTTGADTIANGVPSFF